MLWFRNMCLIRLLDIHYEGCSTIFHYSITHTIPAHTSPIIWDSWGFRTSASFFRIVCTTASFSIACNTLSPADSSFLMFCREVTEVWINKILYPSVSVVWRNYRYSRGYNIWNTKHLWQNLSTISAVAVITYISNASGNCNKTRDCMTSFYEIVMNDQKVHVSKWLVQSFILHWGNVNQMKRSCIWKIHKLLRKPCNV